MGKVGTGISTSLDGFIAGTEGDVGPLFDWYFGGQTAYRVPSAGITLKVSPQSLVDEIGIALVPVLLGDGIRFLDHLGQGPIEQLERTSVVEAPGVTHLRFRVVM